MFRPGSWCDVCVLPDGRIVFVRVEGTNVVCEIEGVEAWRVDVKVPSLFLRCAALADGTVAAIVKADDRPGSALLILRGVVMPLGPTAGNNPVALTATHAYIVTASDQAHRISLADGAQEPVSIRWTGQGIRDVLPNGTVILGDDTLGAQIKGYNFGEYQTRGDLTVGQHANGIGVLIADHFFVARNGPINYGPHGAQSGSRIAVCAFTEGGSYYQTFDPPYPAGPVVPPPPAPVPPLPEPPMATTPNLLDIATATAARHPDLVKANTTEACGRLTEYIVNDLHAADPGFGLLSKRPGEHQYNGHAVDATIYKPTQQVIDMMSGAGDRDPNSGVPANQQFDIRLRWNEVPKRDGNDWMEPVPVDGGTPVPQPTPPPNVHMYDGGEHDTDECDICHRSRFDPVHLIPESTVKHAYNGGEQDTGLCDICQKPVGDPIHDTAPEPQPPPGGTPSPGGIVSFDDDATRLLTQILDSCHAQEERQAEIVAAVQELKDAVGGASKNLLGDVIKNAPGILAGILPFLKGSAVKKPAAKRKRR